jgi:hypothetical protein
LCADSIASVHFSVRSLGENLVMKTWSRGAQTRVSTVGYASSTGMAFDEKWVSAYVNGNYLVASSDRGTTVTWELGATGSAVVVSRR